MSSAIRFGLDGRVAIVTGAAQGIGEACVRRLVAEGMAVALWDVADTAGEALAAALAADGARVLYRHCDVSSKAQVDAALDATLAAFGRVDALVNNAGIFRAADFLDITEADWDAVIGATVRRARPILLTAGTAIFAMIPLSRSVFWGPMAVALMGGLLVATALTLLFLPALYAAWFRVRRPSEAAAPVAEPTSPPLALAAE